MPRKECNSSKSILSLTNYIYKNINIYDIKQV
jgi:hypothetical protein